MDFNTWWEKEGSVMEEGNCPSELIANAAWVACSGYIKAEINSGPDFDIKAPEIEWV